jgi:hypothetical protein
MAGDAVHAADLESLGELRQNPKAAPGATRDKLAVEALEEGKRGGSTCRGNRIRKNRSSRRRMRPEAKLPTFAANFLGPAIAPT